MIKVGDIIDGRRVTLVYELCGGYAYQSEPVENTKYYPKEPAKAEEFMPEPITETAEEKPRRGRRKKEV